MKKPGLKEFITKFTVDASRSIEQRIEDVFNLRQEIMAEDIQQRLKDDVVIFRTLIEMIQKEDENHDNDLSLLQLMTILIETYVELEDFRPIGDLAYDTLEVLRDEMTAADILDQTIPRIAAALERTVYNHYLYEILLRYIKVALEANPGNKELKPQVTLLLKLHVLLDDITWHERLWNKKLRTAIAQLFSSDEMLNIILNPEIGHLKKDPVEYTLEWEKVYYDVEAEVEKRLGSDYPYMGFCFRFWDEKRKVLKEKYNIEWHSPSTMNPNVMFD